MFTKILIANRGEIACRIIRTARRMGIGTVAVYSDADQNALHVGLSDEAVRIGPAPARESYLVGQRLIDAAKRTGAQAIHPGYGFLSENADFCEMVERSALVFIGPDSRSMRAMSDKISARSVAKSAGVAILPGHDEPVADIEQALLIAQSIGYPLMIKASSGGGGKGLRLARDPQQLRESFNACRNEALVGFGSSDVFLERFVEGARHIEIQVLCDHHGNRLSLGERECSIQRRHQKIIEETPSPFVDESLRARMAEQALALAGRVGYRSAGTVEFVVGPDRAFHFLEFNTRLQVEHTVTECVTGLDLVEQMIRIAAGEPLAFSQNDVHCDGWSIECRINSEDPARGFMPSAGRIVEYQPPRTNLAAGDEDAALGIRIDSGVVEGAEVPVHYDPMIAKLIVHGRDRADAIERMRDAINAYRIRGVSTNLDFLGSLLAQPRFRSGEFTTTFLSEHYPGGYPASLQAHADPEFLVALATAARLRWNAQTHSGSNGRATPGDTGKSQSFWVILRDEAGTERRFQILASRSGDAFDMTVDGQVHSIRLVPGSGHGVVHGTWKGKPFHAQVELLGLAYRIAHDGVRIEARVFTDLEARLSALMPKPIARGMQEELRSPMSGLLIELAVCAGQAVRAGERIATIEAMKMENVLVAPADARIQEIVARPGESLAVNQIIVRFV